eukprot:maker-scaffold_18-snap-gene-2.59-mRNA-1 protein AED:0.35 eAED:0.35 QI:30/1/1/1/1/1/2/49/354
MTWQKGIRFLKMNKQESNQQEFNKRFLYAGSEVDYDGKIVLVDKMKILPEWIGTKQVEKLEVFVFSPGNPGWMELYADYFEKIRATKPDMIFIGLSHFNHSASSSCDNIFPLFESQFEVKAKALIEELTKLSQSYSIKGFDLYLAGHSVGSRFLFEVSKILEKKTDLKFTYKVVKLIGLCPTIMSIGESNSGKKMLARKGTILFSSKFRFVIGLFLNVLFTVIRLMPTLLLQLVFFVVNALVVSKEEQLTFEAFKTVLRIIPRSSGLFSLLDLGMEEMFKVDGLEKTEDIEHIEKLSFVFLLSEGDPWVGYEIEKKMKEKFPSAIFSYVKNARHAFCTTSEGNENTAIETLKHL